MIKKLIIHILPLILSSCTIPAYFNSKDITKGIPFDDTCTLLKGYENNVFKIKTEGYEFIVEAYKVGYYPYHYDYFIVYENRRVLFWGHPYEFNRHENPLINEIGLKAMEEYNKVRP